MLQWIDSTSYKKEAININHKEAIYVIYGHSSSGLVTNVADISIRMISLLWILLQSIVCITTCTQDLQVLSYNINFRSRCGIGQVLYTTRRWWGTRTRPPADRTPQTHPRIWYTIPEMFVWWSNKSANHHWWEQKGEHAFVMLMAKASDCGFCCYSTLILVLVMTGWL